MRAAGAESSTWMYRHDLARQKAPDLPLDPHPFLVLFVDLSGGSDPAAQRGGARDQHRRAAAVRHLLRLGRSDPRPIPAISRVCCSGFSPFEIPKALPFDLGY